MVTSAGEPRTMLEAKIEQDKVAVHAEDRVEDDDDDGLDYGNGGFAAETNGTTTPPPTSPPPPMEDSNNYSVYYGNEQQHQPSSAASDETFLLLGMDLSHLSPDRQYATCVLLIFTCSLMYGYLQELISVTLLSRDLAFFLSTVQFSGYAVLVALLRLYPPNNPHDSAKSKDRDNSNDLDTEQKKKTAQEVPFHLFLCISALRALELALTNMAMKYINFPAKTLLKSARVVFTMLFGVSIQQKQYKTDDYLIATGMVFGLGLFLLADARSAAVFQYQGVVMLVLSLFCDGAIVNVSETIMKRYRLGQDDFIAHVYSIALVFVALAGAWTGELREGCVWILSEPGTYAEYVTNAVPKEERSWSVMSKCAVLVLFCVTGFVALSACTAITKNFGALTMSLTSTTRKGTTLFLSYFLFDNVITAGHMVGIFVFGSALATKLLLRSQAAKPQRQKIKRKFSGVGLSKENKTPSSRQHGEHDKESLTHRHHGTAAKSPV